MLFQSLLRNQITHFVSVLECRLDCHPGYVALDVPITTCVDGKYQPKEPHFDKSLKRKNQRHNIAKYNAKFYEIF